MNKLSIHYHNDLYEILFTSSSIHRIEKFVGDSQFRRDVTFDELPEKLQTEIISQIMSDDSD